MNYLQLHGGPHDGWRIPAEENTIYVSGTAGGGVVLAPDPAASVEPTAYHRKGDAYYTSDRLKLILAHEAALEAAKPPPKTPKPPAEYDPAYQPAVDEILSKNPDAVKDFPKSMNFLIGLVMKSNRSLKPDVVRTVILKSIQK